MGWEIALPILAKFSLETFEFIMRKVEEGNDVTLDDIAEIRRIEANTPESTLLRVVAGSNISADDPRVLALMELIKKQ